MIKSDNLRIAIGPPTPPYLLDKQSNKLNLRSKDENLLITFVEKNVSGSIMNHTSAQFHTLWNLNILLSPKEPSLETDFGINIMKTTIPIWFQPRRSGVGCISELVQFAIERNCAEQNSRKNITNQFAFGNSRSKRIIIRTNAIWQQFTKREATNTNQFAFGSKRKQRIGWSG